MSAAIAVKSRLPRPRNFESDVRAAERLKETNQRMPPRLWAAWIGKLAGLQVNHPCYTASGECVGFGTDIGDDPRLRVVSYQRPSEITIAIHRLIGTPTEIWTLKELSDMVMWLDTQEQRNYCYEAVGMLARDDEHEPPGRMVIQKVIGQLAVKQTMLDINSEPARQHREQIRQSPLLTEPAEKFSAALEQLAKNPPHDIVNSFFNEESAA